MDSKDIARVKDITGKVKAVVFGGLGVLFPATVFIDSRGEVLRQRSHVDGQGISFLRSAGLHVCFTTADDQGLFMDVLTSRMNSLDSVKNGTWEPVALFKNVAGSNRVRAVTSWLSAHNVTMQECAYMGDDMEDYEMMKMVGLPAAPASAEQFIKDVALFVAGRDGGYGAVRDLADFILHTQGVDVHALALR